MIVIPTIKISAEQIEFFHREGYLAIDAITTPEEVARIRESYDRLFQERAGRREGNHFDLAGSDEEGAEAKLPQILWPSKYAPELANTLYRANALAIARQLLGPDTEYHGEHAMIREFTAWRLTKLMRRLLSPVPCRREAQLFIIAALCTIPLPIIPQCRAGPIF
jgi:hypothetical protein